MNNIIVALIGAFGTILAVIITSATTKGALMSELKTHNAVQDTKLEELTREVRAHNGFAERIPALEAKVDILNSRVERLEAIYDK